KAGTNLLRGSGFEFFRNSRMDSPNFFDLGDPPPFTRHQFGGTVGGPIVKNRVFFFGGYERLQEDLGTTVITAVPTAAARGGAVNPVVRPYLDLIPLPNGRDLGTGIGQYTYEYNRVTRENFAQGRVDVQLSNKDSLFVRHTYDASRQVAPVSSGAIQTTGFEQFFTKSDSGNRFFTVEAKRTLTQHPESGQYVEPAVVVPAGSAVHGPHLDWRPVAGRQLRRRAIVAEHRLQDVER
ncbi:MAG: hypothetical protein DMF88_26155, partial [Acidobacteria bacterium]